MNLLFFGISDLIIVAFITIMAIIGYKKGFLEKFISMASIFSGFICSCVLCVPLGKFLNKHIINEGNIGNSLYEMIYTKIVENGSDGSGEAISSLGLPKFMNSILNASAQGDNALMIADAIRDKLTLLIAIGIAFVVLLFGITIGIRLLKILVKMFRQFDAFRAVDNALGMAFGVCMSILIIFVIYLVMPVLFQIPQLSGFKEFMDIDMQLSSDSFRLSKLLYDYNLIGKLLESLF